MVIDNIHWLGHGSFRIDAEYCIYIDPWRVVRTDKHADIILISHEHYDHCSVADIQKLRNADSVIIGNDLVAEQVPGTQIIRAWQSMTIGRVSIKAIPAYAPNGLQHPLSAGGLGFVISADYYDIYYAGDTRRIPEMHRIRPDIAILPIDGRDTMTVDEAVAATEVLAPRWVIPCNWGTRGEGATRVDAHDFKSKVDGRTQVVVPAKVRT